MFRSDKKIPALKISVRFRGGCENSIGDSFPVKPAVVSGADTGTAQMQVLERLGEHVAQPERLPEHGVAAVEMPAGDTPAASDVFW